MKSFLAGFVAVLGIVGCSTSEEPGLARARADYESVHAMNDPARAEETSPFVVSGDYAYQGLVRYPLSYLPAVAVNLPIYVTAQVLVLGLFPAMGSGVQDAVYDTAHYTYAEMPGVNVRRIWNVLPSVGRKEYDDIERDRREGEPRPLEVPRGAGSRIQYPAW